MVVPAWRFVSRLTRNGVRVVRTVWGGLDRAARARSLWLVIPLGLDLDERGGPVFGGPREAWLSHLDLLRALERAARDPRLAGVLLRFRGSGPHRFSQAAALRRAVDAVREAGLPVIAWGESLDAAQLWIATGADRVWIPESGGVPLVGLRSEHFYLKDLLEKLEVVPEVVQIGRYKGAGEMATRRSMSPEQREQVESWQGDLFAELVDAVARGRGLSPEAVRDRVDRGPYGAEAAREAGLIDGFLYRDELEEALRPLSRVADGGEAGDPSERKVGFVGLGTYLSAVVEDTGWQPWLRELPRVAYLVASGGIHRGPTRRGIGSQALGSLLESVREDPRVRAAVLRVDSGGGDAVASDLLYREIELTCREKPVVVSMGDMAASGGYYLAAAADAILAEAGSVTGSIGVVGGKVNLEALYRRLGVGREGIESSARAGVFSETRGFTPDERQAVRSGMEAVYEVFVRRVAAGRKLDPDDVRRMGEGRIFSGRRAVDLGLVDRLGGPLEALREAASRAGIREGERYQVEVLPRRPRLPDLRTLLGGAEVGARRLP